MYPLLSNLCSPFRYFIVGVLGLTELLTGYLVRTSLFLVRSAR